MRVVLERCVLMKRVAPISFTVSVSTYALLRFITYFISEADLEWMLSISGIAVLISAFLLLPLKKAKLQFFLLIAALAILFGTSDSIWQDIIQGLQQMRNLIG